MTISNITSIDRNYSSAILDGIQFNSIAKKGLNSSVPYVLANTPWSTGSTSSSMQYAINAVDINWNEGIVPNGDLANGTSKTIKTTGDLLSLINTMQQEIYVLSAAVVALANK